MDSTSAAESLSPYCLISTVELDTTGIGFFGSIAAVNLEPIM